MKLMLPLLLGAIPKSAPFSPPTAPSRAATPTALAGSGGNEDDPAAPVPRYGSDLKALLPPLQKRALQLDKYGRRVYDLTDDGTAKYSLERSGASTVAAAATAPAKGPKERAADASSADFGEVTASSDLKGLLPTRKMRFIKLDKFGRRIERMEDDGTVNTKKELTAGIGSDTADSVPAESVSLATIVSEIDVKDGGGATENAPVLGWGNKSADLKDLLPQQKTRFMKLDKFGQRVQRMEDDGTVNVKKEPAKDAVSGGSGSLKDLLRNRRASLTRYENVDGAGTPSEATPTNYGSLKDLAPTTRATWTTLDFKGGTVEDERRTAKKKEPSSAAGGHLSTKGLQELLPKKALFTKLDFHGRPVEDERRTKKKDAPLGRRPERAQGGRTSSSLRKLLPERTISWRNEVLSSGSATFVRAPGSRERRQRAMREEVTAAAAASRAEDGEEAEARADDDPAGGPAGGAKACANLTTLLPARTMTWKKEQIFSSGSAASMSAAVRGLRQEREPILTGEVTASAAAAALSNMERNEEARDSSGEDLGPE